VSVMSAADAQRATGADHQIAVPRPRAATSAPGDGAGWGTGHASRGWPARAVAPPSRPAVRVQVHVRELQVREWRMTRVRAIETEGHRASRRNGVRLTRRGRLVITWFAIVVSAAAVALIWLAAAGGAAASDRGLPARSAYQGLTRVVVQPGQTLWSIGSAAEPSADPRLVIQQIVQANALGGATIHAGQQLWVPKS
jgi:hypothetical protein